MPKALQKVHHLFIAKLNFLQLPNLRLGIASLIHKEFINIKATRTCNKAHKNMVDGPDEKFTVAEAY